MVSALDWEGLWYILWVYKFTPSNLINVEAGEKIMIVNLN